MCKRMKPLRMPGIEGKGGKLELPDDNKGKTISR